jgi:hypothetical protein
MYILRFIILFFLLSGSFCCQDILQRSYKAVWHDKSGRYTIKENMTDTCKILSLVTREKDFERLQCLTKVGDDEHFIIAETIDINQVLQYWIINKEKDNIEMKTSQIVEGPFDIIKFTNRKKELGIAKVNFQPKIE